MKYFLLYGFLLAFSLTAAGQSTLRGKIMDSESDIPLEEATIFNTTLGVFRKAGLDGLFSIRANENDVLIFSSVGYRPDTIKLSQDILVTGLFLGLKASPLSLDTVTVTQRTYAEDSALRRLEYAHLLERPVKTLRGGNNAQYGFGISISPFTYLSRSEKQKREFRKRYREYEEDAYVDYRFSPPYVHRVTSLEGEELRRFLRQYRPSHNALRRMTDQDLLLYINDSLKKFKDRK